MNQKTQRLTTSGILIAAAVILSLIKVFELPFGGSVTLVSMLPIMLIGFIYGPKWGLFSGAVYGVLQGILGATMSQAFADLDAKNILLVCLLDYIVAFAVLGLAGVFKKGIKNYTVSFTLGIIIAGLLRLVTHFISGFIVYGDWAEWFFTQEGFYSWGETIMNTFSGKGLAAIYSLIYNSLYMVPEIIITAIVGAIIISVPAIKKIVKKA